MIRSSKPARVHETCRCQRKTARNTSALAASKAQTFQNRHATLNHCLPDIGGGRNLMRKKRHRTWTGKLRNQHLRTYVRTCIAKRNEQSIAWVGSPGRGHQPNEQSSTARARPTEHEIPTPLTSSRRSWPRPAASGSSR